MHVTTEQKLFLFNSIVGSMLSCASELLGFHRADGVDLIFNCFVNVFQNREKCTVFYVVKLDICLYLFFL